MSSITEIAPDVYRISTYVPDFDLQFNQFLVDDARLRDARIGLATATQVVIRNGLGLLGVSAL